MIGGITKSQEYEKLSRSHLRNLRWFSLRLHPRNEIRDPLFRGCKQGRAQMRALVSKFWKDESGATAIEYGLIAAGISLAIIATVNGLGSKLNTNFAAINSSLK